MKNVYRNPSFLVYLPTYLIKNFIGTIQINPAGGADLNNGALYSLDSRRQLTLHLTGVSIANGLAWSADNTKFYYIQSGKGTVDQYDYDLTTGAISKSSGPSSNFFLIRVF